MHIPEQPAKRYLLVCLITPEVLLTIVNASPDASRHIIPSEATYLCGWLKREIRWYQFFIYERLLHMWLEEAVPSVNWRRKQNEEFASRRRSLPLP